MSSTLTDLTAATTFATTDLFYALVGGNSRKYTYATLGKLFGNGTLPLAAGTITTSQPLDVDADVERRRGRVYRDEG